jgi:hypothetical protein
MNFSDSAPLPPSQPLTRRRVVSIVAVYAVCLAFGALLFSGNFPGIPGHFTSNVEINGREYYSTWYPLPFPTLGSNSTPPATVTFQNVTFWLWETGWGNPQGAFVHGNGTDLNGSSYSFLLGGPALNANRTTLFVSPDGTFGAYWNGQLFVELLVLV